MSGQAVTFLSIIAAIVFTAVTGLWLVALVAAVLVIGGHCAIFCINDAKHERETNARIQQLIAARN
jgi:Flp pilus assembly protein TadB